MQGDHVSYARASNNIAIRIDDEAGALAALTPQAGARLRRKAWAHLKRINPDGAKKARKLAKTR